MRVLAEINGRATRLPGGVEEHLYEVTLSLCFNVHPGKRTRAQRAYQAEVERLVKSVCRFRSLEVSQIKKRRKRKG